MASGSSWQRLLIVAPLIGAVLALALPVKTGLLAGQTPEPQIPSFRSSTDVVRLEVTVLDKNRRPVRGLTADDFTVTENDRARPVVAFSVVDIPAPERTTSASWMRNAPRDVVDNAGPTAGRLVVIAFDWSIRAVDQAAARRAAHAVIESLGPADQAAIVFTRPTTSTGVPQNFTGDRALLRAAVDRPFGVADVQPPPNEFELADPEGFTSADCHCRTCSMDALARVATALRSVSTRPKVMLLLTAYVRSNEPPMPVRPPPMIPGVRTPSWSELPNACTSPLDEARLKFDRAAADANAAVHVIDVVGLETGVTAPLGPRRIQERLSALPILADMTGGRAVINTNAPEDLVPAILDESSTYYLVGFTPAASAGDTRAHRIEVRSTRPGLTVHSRRVYRRSESAVSNIVSTDSGIVRALGNVLPASDVPLEASVMPVLARNGRDTMGVIVMRMLDSNAPATLRNGVPTVNVLAAAFTPLGRTVISKRRIIELQSAKTSSGFRADHGVVSVLPLAPGRYEIRVAAELSPAASGSVHTFVDVPDFKRERLTMSGVLVQVTPPDIVEPRDEASALVAIPTARRAFSRSEAVDAVAQFSQGTDRTDALGTIAVAVRVTDANDTDVHSAKFSLGPEAFTRRVATQRFRLPVQGLADGAYLLTVTASEGSRSVSRTVRFSIR